MSWKDYFYFSSSQRRALIFVAFIVAGLCIANLFYAFFSKKTGIDELHDSVYMAQVQQFNTSLKDKKWDYKNRHFYTYTTAKKTFKEPPVVLFVFNPNTLDSAGFIRLGLKPYVVRIILKYRSKGGKYRNAIAFSKTYGLSSEQFRLLESYIKIPVEEKPPIINNKQVVITVELNAADTAQLKHLRGIGDALAKRIVAYRSKLGGFSSVNQLKEVWGIAPEIVQQIIPHVTVDVSRIKKIPINKSGIDRLKKHPYINFYRAKAIYEYRKNNGKISSIEECKTIVDESLNPQFWDKIEPYLEF
ncbi:MAG: helix-hairpin-helix domain-containing protein [Paludibacteraceae bacterium]|nr:helix-hairpin-helix domain-containing protein [Paludibacteraceae bacterium]MBN2787340.1 helix-hairpin-helix domain-containing protein [Paludibacteraceae bacterium]